MTGQQATKTDAAFEIPVFYTPKMVAAIESFSPSSSKPKYVMQSWRRLGVPISVLEPMPVTMAQLCLAHDRQYVDDLLNCLIPNGFGNNSPEVAASLPWTSGAMLSAARKAVSNGLVAVAPCSGFHHACHDHGGGYCSFNGLLVACCVLLHEGKAAHIGILDLDHHYGDGTDDIIKVLGLEHAVLHFSAGARWHKPNQAKSFLKILPSLVEEFAACDVMLFQAGVDPHINDELGGWLTSPQLAERDKIVFSTARRINLPVAWTLAGGYQTPLRKVLSLHDNTMVACAHVFAGEAGIRKPVAL